MKKTTSLALLLACAAAAPAAAGASEAFEFLSLDAGARAAAMGGAYTALAEDAGALHYNPAGLSRPRGHQATFMHNAHVQGLNQEYLGYASPWRWGLSLNHFGLGGVPRTTLSNPDATLGDFGVSHQAVGAGYGYAIDDSMSVGAGIKYLRQTIDDVSAHGAALDLGALYQVPEVDGLAIGAVVQNMGPAASFNDSSEKLPLQARLGVGYRFAFNNFTDYDNTVSLDLAKERGTDAAVRLGVETIVIKRVAARLGYSSRNSAGVGLTAGMGWHLRTCSLDYALVAFGDLGIAHRFSATVRWGGVPQVKTWRRGRKKKVSGPPAQKPLEAPAGKEDPVGGETEKKTAPAPAEIPAVVEKAEDVSGRDGVEPHDPGVILDPKTVPSTPPDPVQAPPAGAAVVDDVPGPGAAP